MLSARLSAPFKMVSHQDDSINEAFSLDTLRAYLLTRNLVVLDLSKCKEPPAVFGCIPLLSDFDHLSDTVFNDEPGAAMSKSVAIHQCLQHHLKSAENFTHANGTPIIEPKDEKTIKDESIALIPPKIKEEIAKVIIEKASGDTAPFTLPLTLWQTRQRWEAVQMLRTARDVSGDTAKEPTSSE